MTGFARTLAGTALVTAATAVAGSIATDSDSAWYRRIRKPDWQPPSEVFPVVWTALYGSNAIASADVISTLREEGDDEEAARFKRGLAVNLGLNAGWSYLFFRAHNPPLSAIGAAALACSSIRLARRAGRARCRSGIALAPYAVWTTFATVLSTEIARLNS